MSINFSNFRKSKLFILYILSFIFAFTASIPAYINSSFIQSLTTQQAVGLIFALNAVFSLVALIYIPKLLKKFGNYKITLYLSILYFINFLGLAFFHSTFLVLFCFLISGALSTAIYFNFDIFIEHNSPDMVTGGIRGTYLTSLNLAWLFSPWLAGIIVEQFSFRMIYLIVALIMIPILFIITSSLKDFKDPDYTTFNMFETIKSISSNKNIKNIITSGFMLQFFYSWMVIYGTIYLNHYVGIDFGELKNIVAVARGPSGRIYKLRIEGSKRTVIVGKELEIRRWLSESHLLSSAFVVSKKNSADGSVKSFTITGGGWGHGVGMCQIGAAVMAGKGFKAEQILAHYFQGANLQKLY